MDEHIPLFLSDEVRKQIEQAKQGADDSDHRFIDHLVSGYKWQLYVLNAIQSQGYWGTVHPLQVRPDFGQRDDYSDAFDILVGPSPHQIGVQWTHNLDVKARTRAFESPEDFPFPTIIIEPASRFTARGELLPTHFAMVSQYTGGIIVISSESARDWSTEYKKGRKYITAPKESFMSFDDYIASLPTLPLHSLGKR